MQSVSNRVFDMCVNAGPGTGVRVLQECANAKGATLDVDGVLGPKTLAAVNAMDEEVVLALYRVKRAQYYRDVAEADAAKAKDLPAWLRRAEA